MSFCRKCGSEIKENEKFCPNCGTPVKMAYEEEIGQANNIELDKAKKILKSFIACPVDSICECMQNIEKRTLVIITVFFSIIYGMLFYINEKVFVYSISKILNGTMNRLSYVENINKEFDITFVNLFGSGIMIFIFSIIITFSVKYILTEYVFNIKQEPLKLLGGIVFSMIPCAMLLLLGDVLGIISYIFTIICMVSGCIMFMVCLLKVTCKISSLSLNQGIYVTSFNTVVVLLLNSMFIKSELLNMIGDALRNLLG